MYSEEDEEDDEDLLAPAGVARPRAAWVDDSDLEDSHHHYASTNQDEVLGAFRSAVERHDNAPLPPPPHSLPPRSQSGRHLRAASSSPPPYSPRFTPSSYLSSSAAHSTTHRDALLDEDGESSSSASLLLPAVHETTNHNSSSRNNRRQQAAGVGMSSLLADLEHEAMHWRQAHDTERQRRLDAEAKLAEETHHRQLLPAILAALRTARNRETTRVAVSSSSSSSSGVRDPIRAGTAESFVFLETLNRLVEALEVHVLEDHTVSRTTPDRRPYHEGRMTSTASSLDSAVPLQTTLTTPQSVLPTAEKGGVSLARQFRRQRMLSRNHNTPANNSTAALERPEAAYLVSCLASRAANRTSAARSFYFQSILRQQDTTLLQRYFRRWSQWRSRLFEVRHCGWRRDPRRGKLTAALLLEKMAHRFLFHSFAKWQWFAKMRQFQRHMTQAANLLGAQTTVLARHIRNQALLADEAASQCAMIVEQQTDCLTELLATLPRPTLLMNHGTGAGASSTLLLRSTGR